MGFKDMVAEDIQKTFLDCDVFAEKLLINGKEISAVIDNEQLKSLQGGTNLGITESGTLFFCNKDDLPENISAGATLTVNHRRCLVDDIKFDLGLATVTLRENILG